MSVFEEGLGGNAAHEQARPAERLLLLDDRDPEPELSGSDRRDIPARSGSNDNEIVFLQD
jgi:hypothetical protein